MQDCCGFLLCAGMALITTPTVMGTLTPTMAMGPRLIPLLRERNEVLFNVVVEVVTELDLDLSENVKMLVFTLL